MTPLQRLQIAVIGDQDLVSAMRLAGLTRFKEIGAGANKRTEVRESVAGLIEGREVGIIAIQEDYAGFVEDMIARLKEAKALVPVFVVVPSKTGSGSADVTGYYRAYIRKFIGFEIEL